MVQFIRDLLYEHDCVIVPGFGALIGNYVPAHYDRVKSVFQPPAKQIGFNKRLNHNDGLLAGSISREKQIGYVDAKRIVDEFVASLNKRLQKGETVVFEGIGRFVPDKSKKITFEQDAGANFFLDSYGLSAFHISEREPEHSLRRTEKRLKNLGVDKKDVKKRKFALVAYIGIPVVVAAIAITALYIDAKTGFKFELSSLNPFSASVKSNQAEAVHQIGEQENAQSSEIESRLSAMTSKKTALFYEETKVEEAAKSIVDEITEVHYLVAGSFRNYENAISLKRELESKGYPAEVLDFQNDFYRVSMATYSNRDKAIDELYRVRSDKEFASVWLLTK
jgi:nucleoid DNA-binding protein